MIYYERMESLNSNTEQILTDTEREKILYYLFEWKDWELDASFLYKWKWAELYEKISKDPNYPFINTEIECLSSIPRRMDKKLDKIRKKLKFITDVLCWDGQKAITLLRDMGWECEHITYIAEDYSWQMLDIAEKI